MKINVSINGLGRIGKSVFLQLINHPSIIVRTINIPDFKIKNLEDYLKHDSCHHYDKNFKITIIDDSNFLLNDNHIHLFSTRNASEINYKDYNVDYLIDCTGVYLTQKKCAEHNVKYIIMSAPPKDDTPIFINGVNEHKYNGELIVSNASCTSNSIIPVLKLLDDTYKIKNASFLTIHSSTNSQQVVDCITSSSRTQRSIFNNLIIHSTGASNSIISVMPQLKGKIGGSSVRVPTNNVSLIDLNVEFDVENDVSLNDIMKLFESSPYIQVNDKNLVSSDFMSTTCPSIIDKNGSMVIGKNVFKLSIWYDNEWSYSSQLIKLLENMINKNSVCEKPYFIENYNFTGKNVFLRLDLNCPTDCGTITDDFRITSSLKTINRILKDKPNKLLIVSHFGRPKGKDLKYSTSILLEPLKKYLNEYNENIEFLEHGISQESLNTFNLSSNRIFLLENIRFHAEEEKYKSFKNDPNNLTINMINKFCNIYCNDAFGCAHREHLSIVGIKCFEKCYGYLMDSEIVQLNKILKNNTNKKILAIMGGAKMDDKLPLLESLSKYVNDIYIAGGNINSLLKNDMKDFIDSISKNKSKIHLMKDGLASTSLENKCLYKTVDVLNNSLNNDEYFYDCSVLSIIDINNLIESNDIIIWNGTLGVSENELYKSSSAIIVDLLKKSNKEIIILGGDTNSFVNQYDNNFYKSTGGGSSLEYLSYGSLVGVDFFS
jgi:glyceraldehyde 3-phosphate dehydrogenase